jgi:hypothetical protein
MPKRYQPLWIFDYAIVKVESIDRYYEALVETKDTPSPRPCRRQGRGWGSQNPCQGVAAAMAFALFTAANSGHSSRRVYMHQQYLTCTLYWVPYVSTSCWRDRCTCISGQSISYHAYRRYITTNTYLRRRRCQPHQIGQGEAGQESQTDTVRRRCTSWEKAERE